MTSSCVPMSPAVICAALKRSIAVLSFATEMLARMIDPSIFLVALGVGGLSAFRDTIESRWMVVVAGAAMIVFSIAIFGVLSSAQSGKLFRYDWAAAAAASLQVYLMSLAVGAWRERWQRRPKAHISESVRNTVEAEPA